MTVKFIQYCDYCSGVNQKCTHSACTGNFEKYVSLTSLTDLIKGRIEKLSEGLDQPSFEILELESLLTSLGGRQ